MSNVKTPDVPSGKQSTDELLHEEVKIEVGDALEHPDDAGATEEVGGPSGPEPTRYGDWERKGRCVDF